MTRTLLLDDQESATMLQEVAQSVRRSRKVLFVTGAGISCSAGIPDFRSEDGLYNLVKRKHPTKVVKGQDLFDCNLFRDPATTEIFYSFMAGLRTATLKANPTPTHQLIRYLRDKRRLLRCYTQNIDGLEQRVGLTMGFNDPSRLEVVQLHGDLHLLKCPTCSTETAWKEEHAELLSTGEAPECASCRETEDVRAMCGKRSRPVGVLRPSVVLYGDDHPYGDVIGTCSAKDIRAQPDMLIIAGTSLKVVGIKRLVRDLAKAVHEKGGIVVFVNRTPVNASSWDKIIDYHIETDTDTWVQDLKLRIPTFFKIQSKLHLAEKRPWNKDLDGMVLKTTAKRPRKVNKRPQEVIKPEVEGDLLKCSPDSFGVFNVNPQSVGPVGPAAYNQLNTFASHFDLNLKMEPKVSCSY